MQRGLRELQELVGSGHIVIYALPHCLNFSVLDLLLAVLLIGMGLVLIQSVIEIVIVHGALCFPK